MDYMGTPPMAQPPAMMQPEPGRKPSDSGLSGLGLIMQLVGGVMTAIVACYGMLLLIVLLMSGGGGRGGMPGTILLFMLAVLGTSIARSVCHSAAGQRLLYDGPGTPSSALKRYITVSAVQVGVVVVGMLANDVPGGLMLAIVLLLSAWPVALLIVAKPKIEEFGDAVPMADDKGFEGASILMLIFGIIGTGFGVIMLLGWLDYPGELKKQLLGVATLASFVMLTIRSAFHVRAGFRGSSAKLMSETADAAAKYANFGTIAAVVTGGAILVSMIGTMGAARGGGGGAMMVVMLIMVVMIAWVLLVWPLAIKRFFGDRQFATIVDERAPSQQSSSDRGLPTLGWFLFAYGVYMLASGFAALLIGDLGDERAMRRMSRGGNPLGEMMGLLGGLGGKSPWYGIVIAATQIWAGVELIRMTPRYKIAGMVFGGVAAAIALYVYMPLLDSLMEGGMGMVQNPLSGIGFIMVVMALVLPVATFIFVQRKVRDPKAIAQTFE